MHPLAKLDQQFVWHPFTQMRDWLAGEPIVITSGHGALLRDAHGRQYLDANSSIWTNLHGHNHPKINSAIQKQLRKISHSSALGLANEPASRLAQQLVEAANRNCDSQFLNSRPGPSPARKSKTVSHKLEKVFFSDDGSTALEVALKLAYEFTRRTRKIKAPRFLSLERAYHGDTVGAVSLGHIDLFHKAYGGLLFQSDRAMTPFCYRCPFNRAKPERDDARNYRKCDWECVGKIERKFSRQTKRGNPYAAFVVEPLMQGAAGMIPQPAGWLSRVAEIARSHNTLLIADEVMTGFGRTGFAAADARRLLSKKQEKPEPTHAGGYGNHLFACQHENVQPDFLCLAKGLTGGYLPMAATLTTQKVFDAFLGEYHELKTFFHGHSYTGNQLGAAAGLASLDLLRGENSIRSRMRLETSFRDELQSLWQLPNVGDIRQVGLVAGIELVKDWRTREPFDLRDRAGIRICEAMARRGVLTRPVGNVIVLMPPYCTTLRQMERMVAVLRSSIAGTFQRL
ncbi:MAG TPA: aspartate aminotransferase family protein [Verrucomicrobiae bacterium]|nr:aspartate aminotransferase family protein [Verrucomicrobiae bacterium]